MEIRVYKENVIGDLSAKFLQDLGTTDPVPPRGMLLQAMNEVLVSLRLMCSRFLRPSYDLVADDSLSSADAFVFSFTMGARRMAGKAQSLADAIHSYLVNATLGKVYADSNNTDMAQKRATLAQGDGQLILSLLNSKIPPVV